MQASGSTIAGIRVQTRGIEPIVQERIAKNDALFREANEGIRKAAAEQGHDTGAIPFICECADPTCHTVIVLDVDDYRRIRSNPRRFLNARDHERAALGLARVVEQHDGWTIVEKTGRAGELSEELA